MLFRSIGPSGAGKSTIADLLLRFYEPDTGNIVLNDIRIHELDPMELRGKIVMVEQQARVFNATIYSNIAFGRSARLEEVRRACKLACIDGDIMNFPLGYQTLISYQGGNLSGGQRQRIVLARALLMKADVLVLDESLSALDESTRKAVFENVLSEYADGIVILITHDLSLTQSVDKVIDLTQADGQARHALEPTP